MVRYEVMTAAAMSILLLLVKAANAATVTGKLVDLACAIQDNPRPLCDRMYALEGFEVGVVSNDGKIYHLRGAVTKDNNVRLLPFMTHSITVTGDIREKESQFFLDANDLKNAND